MTFPSLLMVCGRNYAAYRALREIMTIYLTFGDEHRSRHRLFVLHKRVNCVPCYQLRRVCTVLQYIQRTKNLTT